MKKTALRLLFILFAVFAVFSLTINAFAAVGKEIYDGVIYNEDTVTNNNGRSTDIFTIDIDLNKVDIITGLPDNINALQVGPAGRQTVSEMVAAAERGGYTVYAAINADFFKINDDTTIQPEGMVIHDGKLLNPIGAYDSFFGISNDGTAVIGHIAEYIKLIGTVKEAVGGDAYSLIKNGKPITEDAQGGWHGVGYADPRTAVGIKADGTVMLCTVDGRTSKSNGFTLTELAEYMAENGCVRAINLDGGGSAQIGIRNPKTEKFEITNNPSDGKERPIANTILVVAQDSNANQAQGYAVNNTLRTAIIIIGFSLVAFIYLAAFVINIKNKKTISK